MKQLHSESRMGLKILTGRSSILILAVFLLVTFSVDVPAKSISKRIDPDSEVILEDYKEARSYYYYLMGWDENTGIPKPRQLEQMGIA